MQISPILQIGNLNLSSPFILAPMAGISDLPFRLLNRKFGCELAFTEMINVRSLGYRSRKTKGMLSTDKNDRPLGVQILGGEREFILRGLDILKDYEFDILDFNAACPVKKVTSRGEGASLLKEPKKLNQLLKIIVKNSTVPVTVKIRAGWDANSINAKEVALYVEDAGAKAIFIHGRTKTQEYNSQVNYDVIRDVKSALSIPVVASGDILSAELAQRMFNETGCDGVLVARGALGNPWIFKELNGLLADSILGEQPGINERTKIMLEHFNACIDFYGARNGVVIFRKFFNWYTKGLRRVRILREKSCRAKTRDEMLDVIREFNITHLPNILDLGLPIC